MNQEAEVMVNLIAEVRSLLIQIVIIEMKVKGRYNPEVSRKAVQKHKMI